MLRIAPIPVAIGVIVAIPLLIGQQPKPTETAAEPREAELTVEFAGDVSKPVGLLISATGSPPEEATIKTDDGFETATVRPRANCKGIRPRSTGYVGEDPANWCLEIAHVPRHEEVSGSLAGTATAGTPTTLKLTVKQRDTLCPWPLIAIVGGLLVSLIVTFLVDRLATDIGRSRLQRILWANRHARPRDRIAGLDDWVEEHHKNGMTDEELRGIVGPLVKNGPSKAREARKLLRAALEQHSFKPAPVLWEHAYAEADRPSHRVADFLEEDGSTKLHPAKALMADVDALSGYREVLDKRETEIEASLVEDCQDEPHAALRTARIVWERAGTHDDLSRVLAAIGGVDTKLVEKLAQPACRRGDAAATAQSAEPEPAAEPPSPEPTPLGTGAPRLGLLGFWTGVFIVVALTFSFFTVLLATYEPDKTFGELKDYFALFSAALAAGAAGTVAALLVPWGETTGDADA